MKDVLTTDSLAASQTYGAIPTHPVYGAMPTHPVYGAMGTSNMYGAHHTVFDPNDPNYDPEGVASETESVLSFKNRTERPVRVVTTNEGRLDDQSIPRRSGYIWKKGGAVNARGGRKNLKKRWFELEEVNFRQGTGYELKYYDGEDKRSLKGSVGLSEVEVFCPDRSKHKRLRYEFYLMLQNGSKLELACENASEREEWISSLTLVIAYLRRLVVISSGALDGYDPLYEDDEKIYERGELIANNSIAFGPGLFGAEAGKRGNFSVQIRDSQQLPVRKGGMPLTVSIQNHECLYYLRVQDKKDGTYSCHYTLANPGRYEIHILLNDEHHVSGSPFEMEILPTKTSPENCRAEGAALTQVAPLQLSSFTIVAADSFGNAKARGGDPFEVSMLGPAQMRSLKDNEDGTYSCYFEAQNPAASAFLAGASLTIIVMLNGRHITGSPFKPVILDVKPDILAQLSPQRQGSVKTRSPSAAAGSTIFEELMSPYPTPLSTEQKQPPPRAPQLSVPMSATPMSRLERARQRALIAKQLTDGSSMGGADEASSEYRVSRSLNESNYSDDGNTGAEVSRNTEDVQRLFSQLDVLTNAGASGGSRSKLSTVIGSRESRLLAGHGAGSDHVRSALSFDAHDVLAGLRAGLCGPAPPTMGAEEAEMWDMCNSALLAPEVASLLASNLGALKLSYDLFAEPVDGDVQCLKLINSSSGGAYRLLEEYDVIPAYMSRKDFKAAFLLVLTSQRNVESSRNQHTHHSGLDFVNYVKLLVLVAAASLSKTSSFSVQYASMESRVDVLLNKWGLCDPLKFSLVRGNVLKST